MPKEKAKSDFCLHQKTIQMGLFDVKRNFKKKENLKCHSPPSFETGFSSFFSDNIRSKSDWK
jgi:hypothetical protein